MERILADWTENDADDASRYVIEALSFDSCCEMAEAEYEAGLDAYDDYKYDLEREAQPCDYDDEYYQEAYMRRVKTRTTRPRNTAKITIRKKSLRRSKLGNSLPNPRKFV